MANSFLQLGTRVNNIKSYLEGMSSENSIKYRAEKNKSHVIYFPTMQVEDENGNLVNGIISRAAKIHEWEFDKKFYSSICTDGFVIKNEDGTTFTDGSCPFCEAENKSWDIYNWRLDYEKAHCGKTGADLEAHLKKCRSDYAKELKLKQSRTCIYILAVQFNIDDAKNPVLGSDGLPTYELKIMRLSTKQLGSIQTIMDNNRIPLAGSEVIFTYGNQDNPMNLIGERTVTAVFTNNYITVQYPAVVDKINADVAKFDWNGIEKAYPEWKPQSTEVSRNQMAKLFSAWDTYVAHKDEGAEYLEYIGAGKAVTNPSLTGNVQGIGAGLPPMGAMPQMGAMPAQGTAPVGALPQMGAVPAQAPAQAPAQGANQMGAMPQMGATGMTGNGEVEI